MIVGVTADVMLGTPYGVRAPPLHVVPNGATGSARRLVSALGIAIPTARVLTVVLAVTVLDSMTGFRASPLHPVRYGSDTLHRVVLGDIEPSPPPSPLRRCGSI